MAKNIHQRLSKFTLIGLTFAVFADFSSIRENKYPQKIWNDANHENKYPRKKWEKNDDPRIFFFFLTFTYKYNHIQLIQYLLLHDIVYPTCCWHLLFALRFFFPLLCKTTTLCRHLASVFSLDCYCLMYFSFCLLVGLQKTSFQKKTRG